MKRFLIPVLLPFLLSGCASTGDWNEDSLFFSHVKADRRIAAQRAQLRAMENRNAAVDGQTRTLEESVMSESTGRSRDLAARKRLEAEIAAGEQELARKRERLAEMRARIEPDVEASGRLQREIDDLRATVARKRKILALSIYVR